MLRTTAKEIEASTGNKVHAVAADVRDPDALTAAMNGIESAHGVPDIVINNAAGTWIET